MNFIELYLIFIIATASTSTIFLFVPLLTQAAEAGTESVIVRKPLLSTFAYYLVALVFAPVLFFILLSETATKKYKITLSKAIHDSKY
jgi:hypothetical protein